MAIERTDGGTIVTGEHTRLFHYLQLIHALTFEINSGLKLSSRGSVMMAAKVRCGSSKQTKKGVLADMVAFTRTEFPEYRANITVVKAMGKRYSKTVARELAWLATLGGGAAFNTSQTKWTEKTRGELEELGAIIPSGPNSDGATHTVGEISPLLLEYVTGETR